MTKRKAKRKKQKSARKKKEAPKCTFCDNKMFWFTILILIILTTVSFVFDEQIAIWITSFQSEALNGIMLGFTNLVSFAVGVPAVLIIIYLLESARRRKVAISHIFIAIVLDVIVVLALKMLIGRARPFENGAVNNVVPEVFSSFPSGHSSRAFVIFGLLGKFYNYKYIFWFFAVLVGFSRVYLGVHYLSDVLAGAIIGMLVAHYTVELQLGNRLTKLLKRLKEY